MKSYLLILISCVLAASSCVEKLDGFSEDKRDEILISSLLSPDNLVEADLALSHVENSAFQTLYPETAEIELMGTGLQGSSLRFTYVDRTKSYILRNNEFRPSVGGNYQMRAFIPGRDVDTIFAETIIPQQINIASSAWDNVEVTPMGTSIFYSFDLEIEIEQPETIPAWLQIIPTYSIEGGLDDGRIRITEVLDNQNAVEDFFLQEGIYVDLSKLDGNTIKVNVTTLEPFSAAEKISFINLETRSLTEEYYRYHRTLHKQAKYGQSLSTPVTNYTNIENGLGVFAGYSSTKHQLKFN